MAFPPNSPYGMQGFFLGSPTTPNQNIPDILRNHPAWQNANDLSIQQILSKIENAPPYTFFITTGTGPDAFTLLYGRGNNDVVRKEFYYALSTQRWYYNKPPIQASSIPSLSFATQPSEANLDDLIMKISIENHPAWNGSSRDCNSDKVLEFLKNKPFYSYCITQSQLNALVYNFAYCNPLDKTPTLIQFEYRLRDKKWVFPNLEEKSDINLDEFVKKIVHWDSKYGNPNPLKVS